MTSVVDICNLGLGHIGKAPIQSLSEPNERSRKCALFYPVVRDSTLRDHDWVFARKRVYLALSTDTYTGWSYAYTYPSDCIQARKIIDPTGAYTGTRYDLDTERYRQTGKVEYEIITDEAQSKQVIVTNVSEAELQYTRRMTNTNLFDSLYIEALSFKLAAFLAVPLTGKVNLFTGMENKYRMMVGSAKANSANEEYKEPDNVNTIVNARN